MTGRNACPTKEWWNMTEQQAIDHLHSHLPREALFTVAQRRMIESRIDRQSLRCEPLQCDMSSEWVVSISQYPYVHSTFNVELHLAIDGALKHFSESRDVQAKPAKIMAPSVAPHQQQHDRQVG
jgi:hypothetical protein